MVRVPALRQSKRASAVRPRFECLEDRIQPVNDWFTVPGSALDTIRYPIDLTDRITATYKDEVGIYRIADTAGRVAGLLPNQPGYAQAAVQSGQVLFAPTQKKGAHVELDLHGQDLLAFYLIRNGTSADFLVKNPQNVAVGPKIPTAVFSFDGANTKSADFVKATTLLDNTLQFGLEDSLTNARDYNDALVVMGKGLPQRVPGQSVQQTTLTINLKSRSAVFKNEVGMFLTDDLLGKVNGLKPSDPGYAQAALSSPGRTVLFRGTTKPGPKMNVNVTVPGGSSFVFYMVQNGTTEGFLETNAVNSTKGKPVVFFSIPGANPDRIDHVRWIKGNAVGFEDQVGGGDRDFNDVVVTYKVGGLVGLPDLTPPVVVANLTQDTGTNTHDGVTTDPDIVGQVTERSRIKAFKVGIDSQTSSNYTDLLSILQVDKSFHLGTALLEQINLTPLLDGTHTIHIVVADENGLTTNYNFTFTLDRSTPTVTFDLDPSSDSPPTGDHRTTQSTVTLTGQTDPGVSVTLVESNTTVTANETGRFQFTSVLLQLGQNAFTVRATDTAGNVGIATQTITRLQATTGISTIITVGQATILNNVATFDIGLDFFSDQNYQLVYFALDVSPSSAALTQNGTNYSAFTFTPATPLLAQWTRIGTFGNPGTPSLVEFDDSLIAPLGNGNYILGKLSVNLTALGLTPDPALIISLVSSSTRVGAELPGQPATFNFYPVTFNPGFRGVAIVNP